MAAELLLEVVMGLGGEGLPQMAVVASSMAYQVAGGQIVKLQATPFENSC